MDNKDNEKDLCGKVQVEFNNNLTAVKTVSSGSCPDVISAYHINDRVVDTMLETEAPITILRPAMMDKVNKMIGKKLKWRKKYISSLYKI